MTREELTWMGARETRGRLIPLAALLVGIDAEQRRARTIPGHHNTEVIPSSRDRVEGGGGVRPAFSRGKPWHYSR